MLTTEQVEFYNENGYLLLPGLISADEATELRREAHELAARLQQHHNIDATWGSAREGVQEAAKTQILHCHDVQFQSAAFSRLIVDERLTSAASAIMGTPNVQ